MIDAETLGRWLEMAQRLEAAHQDSLDAETLARELDLAYLDALREEARK